MKELPSVVWSLRTTPSRATGFTPFFLVYGAEAILPTDLEYGSTRTKAYDDQSNRTNREDSLDQLEEARCNTPGVYIPLDSEYEFKHVISVNKTDTKV
jgi:hypothetical protein